MKYSFTLILLLFLLPLYSQSTENKLTVVFYNTGNMYDTIDSPDANDSEYTPAGTLKWDTRKYRTKIDDISRVLGSVNQDELPEIIGLAGVENIRVLQDLVRNQNLARGNYEIVHKDSPSEKGTDVAMLYRKGEFTVTVKEFIPVQFPFDSSLKTHDILHVMGKLKDDKDVHFFVNQWIPRIPGQRETESMRMYCAVALRRSIDIILSRDYRARIIVMGNFNDEPTNKSLMNVMQSSNKRKNLAPGEFYNLMYDDHNLNQSGTFFSKGEWNMLDQIIISPNLIKAFSGYGCNYGSGKIFSPEWIMQTNKNGLKEPKAEISDHLPVILTLTKQIPD